MLHDDFLGLSLEGTDLSGPYLDPGGSTLVNLLRNLGRGHLRFGGNLMDRNVAWAPDPAQPLPPWASHRFDDAALDRLGALATATDWSVDLQVGLGHPDPPAAADLVTAADERLGKRLSSVEIGNEPDLFSKDLRDGSYGVDAFTAEWRTVRDAVGRTEPTVAIAGPDLAASASKSWLPSFLSAEGTSLGVVTQHLYAMRGCDGALVTIDGLLSDRTRTSTRDRVAAFVSAAQALGRPMRISESNSVSCSGAPGVSDRFAAALWASDYLLGAAALGVDGVNLHGLLQVCIPYAPVCAVAPGKIEARPVYYGMLLVRMLGTGAITERSADALHVYDVRHDDGTVSTAVINTTAAPHDLPVPGGGASCVARLEAPAIDAADGISLGGATVQPDGSFHPDFVSSPSATVSMPPYSAAVIVPSRDAHCP